MRIAYLCQRRRTIVTMILVMISLFIGFVGQSAWVVGVMSLFAGPPILAGVQTFFTFLIAALFVMLMLMCFAPAQRRQCEILAASSIAFQLIGFALVGYDASFSSPLLAVCSFVLIAMGMDQLIYGRVLDVFGLWRPISSEFTFRVLATPHAAWNAIAPRPDTVSTHWIGALTEVTPTREADVYTARYRLGDGTLLQKTLTVMAQDHPHHMRYHFEPETDDEESRFGAGFYEIWIHDEENGYCQVSISCEYTALRLRTALSLWLDNWLGLEADAMSAFIEGRPDESLHTRLWGEVLRQAT